MTLYSSQYCPETFSRLSSPVRPIRTCIYMYGTHIYIVHAQTLTRTHIHTRPTAACLENPKSMWPTENRKPTLISVIISYTHQFASSCIVCSLPYLSAGLPLFTSSPTVRHSDYSVVVISRSQNVEWVYIK